MKHIIIGTAGHIDHGKTTLIKALTGRDTDRLEEEKRRGITIDLGFTYFDLPSGIRAGIVDVPGHERFISNMTAGVVGMDLALLVIAADEGVMPQTREHVDILETLGVRKCIIALNKSDLVDEEWIAMVEEEIRDEFKDGFLKDAPIVRVSAATGDGIAELTKCIDDMATGQVEERDIHTIPRLAIDRVFTLSGFGTIVTGTLLSGCIHKDDTLELFPTERLCKIRNIQVHGENEAECFAGQRVALNLAGISKSEVKRGYALAPPASMRDTTAIDVRLNILPDCEREIHNRSRLHFYSGTTETLCRAVFLDADKLKAGESCYARIQLENKAAFRRGDRFVVRFYSPLETIGGGVILDANATKKKRFDENALKALKARETGSGADAVEMIIKERGRDSITSAELSKLSAMTPEEIGTLTGELREEGRIGAYEARKETIFWHKDFEYETVEKIRAALAEFHEKHPYRPGIGKSEIYSRHLKRWKITAADALIDSMTAAGLIAREGEYLRGADFVINEDETFLKISGAIMSRFEKAGYELLRYSEAEADASGKPETEDILTLLIARGQIVKLPGDFLIDAGALEKATEAVREKLRGDGSAAVSEIRDLLGTSRKNVMPILEYLDAAKITKRRGDERVLYES